ncbi:MAG: T9SS type A sorting domain-containing protein, partial [Bacteroidales bacterium]
EDIIKPELNVYPNPTNGLLYIEYDFTTINDTYDDVLLEVMGVDAEPNCKQGKISIYSNDGQLVKTLSLNKTKGMESINMQDYKPASYMVEITDCYGFTNSVNIVKQ